MSKYLSAILIVMVSLNAFAQSNAVYNYSIGVIGYSYRQMPKVLDQANSKSYVATVFNNYIAKFNDNLLSYRISGGYMKKSFTFNNVCTNCELVSGTMSDFAGKVGVEKSLNYSKIQPYVAVDLGYKSNRFAGISRNTNDQKQAMADLTGTFLPQHSVLATKEGFIISPVFGLRVNAIKELSVFIESSLDFFYSVARQELVTQDAFNNQTVNKFHRVESLLNPISVGLQFHFGEN